MKTNLILFIIGLLLSTAAFSKPIILTSSNHVVLSGPVNDKSVAEVQSKLGQIAASSPTGSIVYLVLDTPGGSVMAGNQLADFAKALPVVIKPICLFCASMGYHLFQSFDERLVQSSSVLMSHRVSLSGVSGQIPGELVSRVKFYTDISVEMDKVVAKRIKLSLEEYQRLIYDELWLTGQQAVDSKHADRIANLACSADLLKGVRTEEVSTLFGPAEVAMSKCPLIQGVLGFKLGRIIIQPRNNNEVILEINKKRRTSILGWF